MNISSRLYAWLLLAYPAEFRRRFGSEMLQVFRDCYRAESRAGSVSIFWFRTLSDLAFTAAKERADSSAKKGLFMDRRSDLTALLVCVGIIVIAFLLLTYGRRNEIGSILVFGRVLDALITAGIIGNVIVFILNKATKLNPLRTALWTLAVVHAVLLLLIVLLVSRIDPTFNLPGVVIAYVMSFAIWAGLHFAWQRRPPAYS